MKLDHLIATQSDVLRAVENRLQMEPDSAMLRCILEGQIKVKYLLRELEKI